MQSAGKLELGMRLGIAHHAVKLKHPPEFGFNESVTHAAILILAGAPVCDRLFALATPKAGTDRRSTLSRFRAELEISGLIACFRIGSRSLVLVLVLVLVLENPSKIEDEDGDENEEDLRA